MGDLQGLFLKSKNIRVFFFVVASVSFVLFLMGKINMSVCGMGGKGVLTGDWGKRRKQEGGYQLGS